MCGVKKYAGRGLGGVRQNQVRSTNTSGVPRVGIVRYDRNQQKKAWAVKKRKEQSKHQLASSDQQGNSTRFTTFMLEVIEDTLSQNAPASALANAPVNLKGLKTPQAILTCIQQNNEVTRQEMAERIGKDLRTIARAIKRLQESGRLKRVGSTKTGHWEIVE